MFGIWNIRDGFSPPYFDPTISLDFTLHFWPWMMEWSVESRDCYENRLWTFWCSLILAGLILSNKISTHAKKGDSRFFYVALKNLPMFTFLSNLAELELIKSQIGLLIVVNSGQSLGHDRRWFISAIFTDTDSRMFTLLGQDEVIKRVYQCIHNIDWFLFFSIKAFHNCSTAASTNERNQANSIDINFKTEIPKPK